MYHVATPPAEHPEVFELRSDLEGDEQDEWYVGMVSDTSILWFRMDSGEKDHPGELCWSNDPLMDWYHGLLCTLDWRQGAHDEDEKLYIRAVPAGQLVVIDSGADISLLPYHLSGCGIPKPGGKTILEDAQGERLQTFGRRSARVECEGLNNDLVVIEDAFIVVSVQSALISLGRLLRRGRSLNPNSRAGAMVTLVSPDGEAEVPLEFKRNSMAVCASIRVVSARDASSTSTSTSASMAQLPKQPKQVPEPKLGKIIEEENDMMAIQTVIIRKEELMRHMFRRGWNTSNSGNPFIMPESKTNLNPKWVYSRADWPMGSTMFQRDDFSWEFVEFCNSDFVYGFEDVGIEECSRPTFILTMSHKREEPFAVLGAFGEQELVEIGGRNGDPNLFEFPEEPNS